MKLGSKRPKVESLPEDWLANRWRKPREASICDICNDGDGWPLVGTPLGRCQIELTGCIARETFKYGHLIGWHGRNGEHPIMQYPDGSREVLESLAQTNWKHG